MDCRFISASPLHLAVQVSIVTFSVPSRWTGASPAPASAPCGAGIDRHFFNADSMDWRFFSASPRHLAVQVPSDTFQCRMDGLALLQRQPRAPCGAASISTSSVPNRWTDASPVPALRTLRRRYRSALLQYRFNGLVLLQRQPHAPFGAHLEHQSPCTLRRSIDRHFFSAASMD